MLGRKDKPPPPTDYPKTIEAALDWLDAHSDIEVRSDIRSLQSDQLGQAYRDYGMNIRAALGLWGKNAELIAALPDDERFADNASMFLIERWWVRLRSEGSRMLTFTGHVLLLDIEGTTSSIRFVYDKMFPFVRHELAPFLVEKNTHPDVLAAATQIAFDAGKRSLSELVGSDNLRATQAQEKLASEVLRQMDADLKATGLKQLQGLIWEAGFESGQLRAHVYDDVPPALRKWRDIGLELLIYSSGSIQAQKLFFGHTIAGDLLPLLSGHYDTTIGGKREAASYQRIVADIGCVAGDVLFLSDVAAELDAAKQAGLATGLLIRPGNSPQANEQQHPAVDSFAQIIARTC